MKRFLSLALMMVCLTSALSASAMEDTSVDYNVAGKLYRQLWAGSGFSGTLTLEISSAEGKLGQAVTTQKPLVMNLDYIYIRPDAGQAGQHRADLTLMDGEVAKTAAHLQLGGERLSLQADLVGPDWYILDSGTAGATQPGGDTLASSLAATKDELLTRTGMPGILSFALPLLMTMENQNADLSDALSAYTTRVDLWIEGHRQEAVMGKLKDGTSTMEVEYVISPAAIKAQAKQMLLDLLSDTELLAKLKGMMSEEDAELFLNPQYQGYYFAAIDALPLTGNLTISRTVSLKGDTLAMRLSMPLYDSQGGGAVLRYDRVRGEGDLPDTNTLTIESDEQLISFDYLEYSSMTGVTVWQGSLESRKKESADLAAAQTEPSEEARKPFAITFSLTREETEGKDEEGRDVYDYQAALSVAPDIKKYTPSQMISFPALDVSLKAHFASKTLKKASTEMAATLTVSGESRPQVVTVTLEGKSRKSWEVEPLPEESVNLNLMTQADWEAMLPGITTRAGLALLHYFNLPMEDMAAMPPTSASPEPAISETLAP